MIPNDGVLPPAPPPPLHVRTGFLQMTRRRTIEAPWQHVIEVRCRHGGVARLTIDDPAPELAHEALSAAAARLCAGFWAAASHLCECARGPIVQVDAFRPDFTLLIAV